MKADNSKVTFRRIKGRIVPIKLTKSQKEQAKGAAIAAAGAAVAAGGGRAYKAAVTKSATLSFKGFNLLDKALKRAGPAQMSLSANSALAAGKRLASLSKSIRLGSTIVGAGLIGYGTTKFVNSLSKEQKKKVSPEILAGGTAAAAVIAPKAWEFSKKSFTAGMANKQTTMVFANKQWTQHGPKITQALKALIKTKL